MNTDPGDFHTNYAEELTQIGSKPFPHNKTKRQEILEQAIREVCTVKADSYGKPESSFASIAELWTIYLKRSKPSDQPLGLAFRVLSPTDVSIMMILLKIAREMNKHKEDNLVDIAGYAACAAEVSLTK